MKGHILGLDEVAGVIAGENGNRYSLSRAEWRGTVAPAVAMPVDFVADGDQAVDAYPILDSNYEPDVEGTPSSGKLFPRLKNLILHPAIEWQAIGAEEIGVGRLLGETALLSGIASLILGLQFAAFFGFLFAVIPPNPKGPPLPAGMAMLAFGGGMLVFIIVAGVIGALFRVAVEALVARFVAPGFDGRGSYRSALKLITFATTPMWLATMVPIAGLFLQWIGWGYSIYQIYVGSRATLGVPKPKRVIFTAVTVIGSWTISVVLMFVLYFLLYASMMAVVLALGGGAAAVGAAAGH